MNQLEVAGVCPIQLTARAPPCWFPSLPETTPRRWTTNRHQFRGIVWHQWTGSQYVSWASGRVLQGVHVENSMIQSNSGIEGQTPENGGSHPILSLWYDHVTKVVLTLWVKYPAGDSAGTGGDLGKVPFADRRGLWIQLAVARMVLVGTSRIVNKLGTGRCGAIKVFQADTLRWKIVASTVLCPMKTSK